jgi:hypothetical protein
MGGGLGREEPGTSPQGAPVFPHGLGIDSEPKTPGSRWLPVVHDPWDLMLQPTQAEVVVVYCCGRGLASVLLINAVTVPDAGPGLTESGYYHDTHIKLSD